jgi:hypothetical protein
MKKSLRQLYKEGRLWRPTLYMMGFKLLVLAVLALAWHRFLDHGMRSVWFGVSNLGLILLIFAWFSYLARDGVTIHHLMEGWTKKKEPKIRAHDMIDFVDEPVVSFHDLEKEEKTACRLVSSLVVGGGAFLVGTIVSLF